jgi:hypothetical protein
VGPTLLLECVQVAMVCPAIERARQIESFAPLVLRLRQRGCLKRQRDASARSQLRRAIQLVDRVFPSGPNCYRRVLLEIALDSGAAREPVYFGLRAAGGPGSGHAWLGGDRGSPEAYDAVFTV